MWDALVDALMSSTLNGYLPRNKSKWKCQHPVLQWYFLQQKDNIYCLDIWYIALLVLDKI